MKLKIASMVLVLLGLLQSIGHITQVKALKQLGLVSMASPLPIVFTQQQGLETFSLEFKLEYIQDNSPQSIQVTPELYGKLDKPYNYRNVLGAAISYGPLLPKPLVTSVLNYAFVEPATVSKAFGLGVLEEPVIKLRSKTKNRDQAFTLSIGGQDAK